MEMALKSDRVPGEAALTTKQDQQTAAIRDALAQQAGAMTLADIEAAVGVGIPRRTLIRRLAAMVEQGLIAKSGVSRGVRYTAVVPTPAVPRASSPSAQADMFVPLSKEGGQISRLILVR